MRSLLQIFSEIYQINKKSQDVKSINALLFLITDLVDEKKASLEKSCMRHAVIGPNTLSNRKLQKYTDMCINNQFLFNIHNLRMVHYHHCKYIQETGIK